MHGFRSVVLMLVCVLVACNGSSPTSGTSTPAAPPAPAATPPPTAPTDAASAWIGRWTGPEGTYLDVAADDGKYSVAIRNLDGERTFDADSYGGFLTFVRDSITEVIRPGSGAETGMKWLQEKSDCLIVNDGEGYCRD